MGAAGGLAFTPAALAAESPFLGVHLVLAGWLVGVGCGEVAFGRFRGRARRALGMRLVPPALTLVWTVCAALACAVALSAVAGSLSGEAVGTGRRLGAVATLAVVAAVQAMVRELRLRAVPQGPADLVGAELATRSRTARSLMAAGSAVALWTSVYATAEESWSPWVQQLGVLLGCVLPIVAWFMSVVPYQVGTARRRWDAAPAVVGVAVACTALYAVGPVPSRPALQAAPRTGYPAEPFAYACLEFATGRWTLVDGDEQIPVDRAATTVPGAHTRAPFAVSGDGRTVVYLDRSSHRLVAQRPPAAPRPLTGPLPGGTTPQVALSGDGRHAVIGAELIDTSTGTRVPLPGARRVLGLGPDRIVATTAPRALPGTPDTELLTFDLTGSIRTRTPFDPTLEALLTPDGRDLAVVSGDELLTMDAGTGRVHRRTGMRLPAHSGEPELLGWAADGRLLVALDPEDGAAHHLLDPRTGRARPVEGIPVEGHTIALGSSR
ncbi:hypothetical protein [Nonomuraea sp. NPDC050783]|uniref:hypothetical protein n=1 Tax=Nonomuraea sp. NPDC050783 TaxID=3154634 RepID=UPI0034653302